MSGQVYGWDVDGAIRCRQRLAREQQVERGIPGQHTRQHGRAAAAREDAEIGMRVPDRRRLGGDDEVGTQGDLQPTCQRDAIEHRDRRLRKRSELLEDEPSPLEEIRLAWLRVRGKGLLQVGPGAECRTRAGEQQHAYFVVDRQRRQLRAESVEHVGVERIHRAGAIHRQPRDRADLLENQRRLLHAPTLARAPVERLSGG